jgi:ribosomal subunit interface protein
MQIIVASRHFKVFKEIKREIVEALSEIDKESWKINKVEAVLNREHKKFTVELLINGKNLHIETHTQADDLLRAFYMAYDKSLRQIYKVIDRRNCHKAINLYDLEIISEEFISRSTDISA